MVIVAALSKGLDNAQQEVLQPLTGVGTDLSVSRPITVPDDDDSGGGGAGGPFGQLSEREQRQLQRGDRAGRSRRACRDLLHLLGRQPLPSRVGRHGGLSWVGAHTSPRTSVVFDAIWAGVLGGHSDLYGARELLRSVEQVREPLRWGIPDGQVDETLGAVGLHAERILTPEAPAAYVTRTDGSLLGRPDGFGIVVHARVERGATNS